MGGQNGGNWLSLNDVWSSPNGVNWTIQTANAPWTKRLDFASTVLNNKIWITGGVINALFGPCQAGSNDVWSSSNGINWAQATSSAPWSKRWGHELVALRTKLFVIGGLACSSGGNDVWSSQDGATWMQETANAPWSSRYRHAAAVFQGKIWVLGGNATAGGLKNDVWSSPNGISWTQVTANAPWAPRAELKVVVFNNKLWVIGGTNYGTVFNDIWSSPDGVNWTQVSPSATPSPWQGHTSFAAVVAP